MKCSEHSIIDSSTQYELKPKKDKDSAQKQIENSVNDQKLLWGLIKKVSGGSLVKTIIPAKYWYDYYSTLPKRKPKNLNFDRFVKNYLPTHDRNCSVCSGEDSLGLHELLELSKDGVNGIPNEAGY